MRATQRIGEGLTFEKVWAAMMELKESQKETAQQMKETDRQLKERMEEAARQMRETDKQLKEQMKKTSRQLGYLNNRFGKMAEYMVAPNLVARFNELGLEFETIIRNAKIKNSKLNISTEVDARLENSNVVMIVETKTNPTVHDISKHVERMEKLRRYADSQNDTRAYMGAMAGVIFGDEEKDYAYQQGFYVVEPSGDTFTITAPTGNYSPREW